MGNKYLSPAGLPCPPGWCCIRIGVGGLFRNVVHSTQRFWSAPHWTLTFGPIILQSTFNTAIASFPIDSFMIDDLDWAIIFGTSSPDFTAQFRRLIFPMKYVVFQTDGFRSSAVHLFDINLATPQLISMESKDFCVRKKSDLSFPWIMIQCCFEWWSAGGIWGNSQEIWEKF